jgi:hypothetical protein
MHWAARIALMVSVMPGPVHAQMDAPVISGGAAVVSTTDRGNTFVQPIVSPVALVPLGSRFLVESRADLRGFLQGSPTGSGGGVDGQFFASLEYLQLDTIVDSHMTLSVGRFLTPFNIYNERFNAVWIRNIQDVPLIFPIGTRTSGSSDGAMLRGLLMDGSKVQLTYATFFSAGSTASQFQAGRSYGGRISTFLPRLRLEVGGSWEKLMEGQHYNSTGAFLTWLPYSVPLAVQGEFAHSRAGYGYWLEAALQSQDRANGWKRRFQPIVRAQQFVRKNHLPDDSLPSVNTQQFDAGLNYYLPHELRLQSSYGRQLSGIGDHNVWTLALTYRFLMPLARGNK